MEYSKPTPSPFWFEFKLATTCTIPKFNATLYCQLVGGPFVFESYLYLYFVLFPGICKHPIKAIGKEKKRILWYVWGIVQFGIHYISKGTPLLVGFTVSDWADDLDDQKSTVEYDFSIGFGPVTWAYKKQHNISFSLAEEEY
jgi:hypothetical protein